MPTDLQAFIAESPLVNTHEHLCRNEEMLAEPPDVLSLIIGHYLGADLVVADPSLPNHEWGIDGSGQLNASVPLAERHALLEKALELTRHTSYSRAMRRMAKHCWDIDDFSLSSLERAQAQLEAAWQDGVRLRLLRDVARHDHVQIDKFEFTVTPDSEDPAFFLYDIRFCDFTSGHYEDLAVKIPAVTGREIAGPASLGEIIDDVFDTYGPIAIAAKNPHAYLRTLAWQRRSDGEAEAALARILRDKDAAAREDQLCLGDWAMSRCIEAATRHHLPVKIHTGYYAGHSKMPMHRIHPEHLCSLLIAYPQTRFVLMHIGYPFENELIALAKHFPNVWVDMCWAWSIDEAASRDFVRRFVSAVPGNKLFAFGGDTIYPWGSLGYTLQARDGLTAALQACVDDGFIIEKDAIQLAGRFMMENQYAVFDVEGTRAAIREHLAVAGHQA